MPQERFISTTGNIQFNYKNHYILLSNKVAIYHIPFKTYKSLGENDGINRIIMVNYCSNKIFWRYLKNEIKFKTS